jgi:hypothetical protein
MKAQFQTTIGEIRQKILDLQAAKAAGGMSKADEVEVHDALVELSTIANPDVQNPPDMPPDPFVA